MVTGIRYTYVSAIFLEFRDYHSPKLLQAIQEDLGEYLWYVGPAKLRGYHTKPPSSGKTHFDILSPLVIARGSARIMNR